MNKDKVKIKIMSGPMPMGEMSHGPADRVSIERIDNGYIVHACGLGKEETKFVKNLASAPAIVSRMMGIKGKSGRQISDDMEVTEHKRT